jgi:SAM-dependent methyltransferase
MMLDRRFDLQREFGLYESETHAVVRRYVKPGTVVYDIGAGDGYEALGFARLGARVFAFDPDPDAAARLRQNLEMNPALSRRVTVYGELFPPARELPSADFAKLDVDGGERAVLQHLDSVPALLIETHSAELEAACISYLVDRGYTTTVIPNASWRTLYPEWRPIEHNRWLVASRVGVPDS